MSRTSNEIYLSNLDVGIVLVGPPYTAGYGNSDVGYTAKSYAGPYAAQQVCTPSRPPTRYNNVALAKAMR